VLRALEVRDFVIVESASLELGRGYTVLTGETGAGKSILVDAIELLVGGKGDAAVVRQGAERAELSAEFDFQKNEVLNTWLEKNELHGDAESILVRRTIDKSGRSRSFVNGHAVTLAQLKEVGEFLVDIHGQHAHQSLLRAAAQRELLDAQGDAQQLALQTAEAHRAWKRLEEVCLQTQKNFAAQEAERETLAEAEGACLSQLSAVAARLRALSAHDARLGSIVGMLESAEAQAGEAARELRQYASGLDLDPDALREVEARIEALHAAGRKYRVKAEALPGHLAALEKRLAELQLAVDPQALQKEAAAARGRFESLASKLTAKRQGAAQALSRAVSGAMQQLAMAGGRFAVKLIPLEEPRAAGAEEIEFEVASHPSLPLRPLARVASGGELSRISLAIQLVAAKSSPVATLVFDEVDSGMGGAVAETIGKSLKRLGKERQVLCVTHLPQVAAQGDEQWSVEKGGTRAAVSMRLSRLDRSARIDELARMLGGSEATARRHAAELLDAR